MSRTRRRIRLALIILGVLLLTVTLIFLAGVPLSLAFLKQRLEDNASHALGIPLHIDGEIDATTGLKPVVEISGIWLGENREQALAAIDSAEIQFELIPLFNREFRLNHLSLAGVTADFSEPWPLDPPPTDPGGAPFVLYLPLDAEALNVSLRLPGPNQGEPSDATFTSIRTEHAIGRKLSLVAQGQWHDAPVSLTIDSDPLWRVPVDLSNYRVLIQAQALSTSFTADGVLALEGDGRNAQFSIDLSAEDQTLLARVIGQPGYPVAPFSLRGGVMLSRAGITLSNMAVELPQARGLVDLQLSRSERDATLAGDVAISYLDVPNLLRVMRETPSVALPLDQNDSRESPAWTGSLRIDASGIEGAPLGLYATSLDLQVAGDALDATVHSLRALGTQWRGEASMTVSGACRPLSLNLRGERLLPAYLFARDPDDSSVQGDLANPELAGRMCLSDPLARRQAPSFDLVTGTGTLTAERNGRLLTMPLEAVRLRADDENSSARLVGRFLDQPFDLTLRSASMGAILSQDRLPLDLTGTLRRGVVTSSAVLTGLPDSPAAAGEISIRGLDQNPERLLRLDDALSAEFQFDAGQFAVSDIEINLGDSRLTGAVTGGTIDDLPTVALQVRADRIDVEDIRRLTLGLDAETRQLARLRSEYDWLIDDLPGLGQLDRGNAIRLDLEVSTLTGLDLDTRSLRLSGALEPDRLNLEELSVNLEGIPLRGAGEINLRGDSARMTLQADAVNADVGAILEQRGIIQDLDIFAGSLALQAEGTGRSLSDLLQDIALTGELRNTAIGRRVGESGATAVELVLDRVSLYLAEDRRLALDGDGSLLNWPLAIQARTLPPGELLVGDQPIPITLEIQSNDDSATLDLRLKRPVNARSYAGQLTFQGQRLDLLDQSGAVNPPPLGPYAGELRIGVSPGSVLLDQIDASIGRTQIEGAMSIGHGEGRPALDAELTLPVLDIRDFIAPAGDDDGTDTDRKPMATIDFLVATLTSDWVEGLRDNLNMDLDLRADRILIDDQYLGEGELGIGFDSSAVHVDPARLRLGDGRIGGEVFYGDRAGNRALDVNLNIDGIDYGILRRIHDPSDEQSGLIFASANISGQGATEQAMREAMTGSAQVSIWPSGLSARVIDLWASNVLLSVFNLVGLSNSSEVNCALANFDIRDGILSSEDILIDTTRVLILGRGDIDLARGTLNLGFVPQSKDAAFFSIETPVKVRGDFDDYQVSVGPLDAAMSGLRVYYNLVYVPVKKLFGTRYPADGIETCLNALNWLDPETQPQALRALISPAAN